MTTIDAASGSVRQSEPRPNPGRRALAALAAWTEFRSNVRAPEFAIGAVVIPLLLYAMFGLAYAGNPLPGGTDVALAILVSMSCYGTVSLAIFVFGENLAGERGRGWTRTMRATPLPTWVHLAAKIANAVALAMIIVVTMALLARFGAGVRLTVGEWLALGAVLVSAVLIFAPLGFAIAFVAKPRAAAVISNLIFLPLAFASGFFMPLSQLPEVMRHIAEFLPTFHFGQLAYRVVIPDGDVEYWTAAATRPTWVHITWVVASAVVFGAAAILAARREAVTRRG